MCLGRKDFQKKFIKKRMFRKSWKIICIYVLKLYIAVVKNMSKAILSIELTEENGFEVRFQGENGFELPMIWSLKFAEKYLMDRLESQSAQAMQSRSTDDEDEFNEQNEKIMSKQEAIWFYLDARKTIESRLQKINSSSDKATFTVSESLLQNL